MQFVPTTEKIKIKWFVYAGGEKIARVSTMRGRWDWDASCSCGWETKTGGGVYSWVKDLVETHKIQEHNYTIKVGA
jgi:hypothetical protein